MFEDQAIVSDLARWISYRLYINTKHSTDGEERVAVWSKTAKSAAANSGVQPQITAQKMHCQALKPWFRRGLGPPYSPQVYSEGNGTFGIVSQMNKKSLHYELSQCANAVFLRWQSNEIPMEKTSPFFIPTTSPFPREREKTCHATGSSTTTGSVTVQSGIQFGRHT